MNIEFIRQFINGQENRRMNLQYVSSEYSGCRPKTGKCENKSLLCVMCLEVLFSRSLFFSG